MQKSLSIMGLLRLATPNTQHFAKTLLIMHILKITWDSLWDNCNSVVWLTQRVDCAQRRQRLSKYHESVSQPSVVMLSRSWLRKYGTVYHQVWHHRQVWKFSSLAWKQSCSRDATGLTNFDLLCTFITCFVDCMLRALEVFWLYVTLIAFVIIIIIIIIIIYSPKPTHEWLLKVRSHRICNRYMRIT